MQAIAKIPEVHVFAFDRYSQGQIELLNETIRYLQALVKKDFAYIKDHVDPQASYETPTGNKETYHEEFLRLQRKGTDYQSVTIQAPMIRTFQETGFVSVVALFKGSQSEKKGIYPKQLSLHFKKENGQWKII